MYTKRWPWVPVPTQGSLSKARPAGPVLSVATVLTLLNNMNETNSELVVVDADLLLLMAEFELITESKEDV